MVNFSVITSYELEFVLRIALAFIYGGLIGFERERVDRPAGLRTHILVALGSTQFTILSFYAFPGSDPARIAAAIVAGIGFIGAGTILQSKDKVTGITTAASLWITASIGMALGIGYYLIATIVVILTYITLKLKWLERRHN
ncbi:MgtC/SapB family protein [Candidatus Bathyarchaeota archaeon]|jgi:putative Mg2+ transporter-C (MgtC) family protein|nr:MgtC/SapB family protein [Candidatus Bathyarchaeota archaeon]